MSEVTKLYCDRCGNEITENNYYQITTPYGRPTYTQSLYLKILNLLHGYEPRRVWKQEDYDLCEDCNKKLHEWLGIKDGSEENK